MVAHLVLQNENARTNPTVAPAIIDIPKPPKDMLDAVGIAEWNTMARRLIDMGLLTELDTQALMLYCDAYSDWCRAVRELNKTDRDIIRKGKTNGGQYRNAWFDVKKKAAAEMNQYLALFGLSPLDRKKMAAQGSKPVDRRPNDFDEF